MFSDIARRFNRLIEPLYGGFVILVQGMDWEGAAERERIVDIAEWVASHSDLGLPLDPFDRVGFTPNLFDEIELRPKFSEARTPRDIRIAREVRRAMDIGNSIWDRATPKGHAYFYTVSRLIEIGSSSRELVLIAGLPTEPLSITLSTS